LLPAQQRSAPIVALSIGTSTASAAPGISFSGNGSDPVGIGDNTATGAQASSTKGNNALAISMFQPSVASSGDNANGNNLLAVDGSAGAGLNAKGNNVVAVGGVSEVTDDAEGNTIVNVGGKVTASGNATNAVSVSACNTSFTGQADHVT
jgi:hypothetical protein